MADQKDSASPVAPCIPPLATEPYRAPNECNLCSHCSLGQDRSLDQGRSGYALTAAFAVPVGDPKGSTFTYAETDPEWCVSTLQDCGGGWKEHGRAHCLTLGPGGTCTVMDGRLHTAYLPPRLRCGQRQGAFHVIQRARMFHWLCSAQALPLPPPPVRPLQPSLPIQARCGGFPGGFLFLLFRVCIVGPSGCVAPLGLCCLVDVTVWT